VNFFDKKNNQTTSQFIQKLAYYFNQDFSFISSQNGLNCGSLSDQEIIDLIIKRDSVINYDLLFHNIFILNPKINKYIDLNKLSKIKYNDNLESIQILLRILTHKRIKNFLLNDFKLISSIERSINDFKNIFTTVKKIQLIKDKNQYPKFLKNTSQKVFKVIYNNEDIFYFKNVNRKLKINNDRLDTTSSIKNSQLRPSSLNLNDKYSKEQLIKLLKLKLGKITSDDKIKNILLSILNSLKNNSEKIEIKGLCELLKQISIDDEKSIFRDFGEIISAINFCQNNQKIYFSKQNEQLIDFVIEDGEQKKFYSCKFSSSHNKSIGGSRSSVSIIKDYMKIFEDKLTEDQKELYELLKIIVETKGAFNSYSSLAEYLKISNWCEEQFNSLPEKEKFFGKKIYIYAMNCKKTLNNSKYVKTLNEILNSMNIEQVYLIYNKEDSIYFDIKNFSELNFVFDSAVSINKFNCKLSFRMK
jgi:hypothetical protein